MHEAKGLSPVRNIYFFGDGQVECDPKCKDVLGGKGASLTAMCRAGLPVPPGFTISIACCRHYHQHGKTWPEGLEDELRAYMARLEEATGKRFGAARARCWSRCGPALPCPCPA